MTNNIQKKIMAERSQLSTTRTESIREVEKYLGGRTLVTFFTSFEHPVQIDNDDCDMLQSILQHIDLTGGLALMIDSPGGDGLAAERAVNICRAYSGTKDYWAIVPGRAKSAATIIAMGASKILMGAPSELGPVDPQIIRREEGVWRYFSAYSLVAGYESLFNSAVRSKGNMEPFVLQLRKYDVREINKYRDQIKLAEDIAVKILRSGTMKGQTDAAIRKKIGIFLDPSKGTISHGRSINSEEADGAGLTVEVMDVHSPQWIATYELYARTEMFVSSQYAAKAMESRDECFYISPPRGGGS